MLLGSQARAIILLIAIELVIRGLLVGLPNNESEWIQLSALIIISLLVLLRIRALDTDLFAIIRWLSTFRFLSPARILARVSRLAGWSLSADPYLTPAVLHLRQTGKSAIARAIFSLRAGALTGGLAMQEDLGGIELHVLTDDEPQHQSVQRFDAWFSKTQQTGTLPGPDGDARNRSSKRETL